MESIYMYIIYGLAAKHAATSRKNDSRRTIMTTRFLNPLHACGFSSWASFRKRFDLNTLKVFIVGCGVMFYRIIYVAEML